MVQFGEAQLVLVTSTDPSRLQLMVKHTASSTLDVQFSTGVHGVPLRKCNRSGRSPRLPVTPGCR